MITLLTFITCVSSGPDQIRVLVIDGVNNHDWKSTTIATKGTLEKTGKFAVDVSYFTLEKSS